MLCNRLPWLEGCRPDNRNADYTLKELLSDGISIPETNYHTEKIKEDVMQRLLPPILFITLIVTMVLLCWAMGSPHHIEEPLNYLGLLFTAGGISVAFYHSRLFKIRNANIMTFGKPTLIVKDGLFKYSRNPMYLGFLVSLLGVAILVHGAYTSFACVAVFYLAAQYWYIPFEERRMLETFGEQYADYCKKTPRWIKFV